MYPIEEQTYLIYKSFRCICFVYNRILAKRNIKR
ncbi:helix-turn-helix domain-containing protein [Bacillus cereus]|nr:helix-turn-helix domain-containing protein [Bacillus thuringiensis]MEB8897696.1 helix-turn-helix domain-containing protein [Bacillus cereus]